MLYLNARYLFFTVVQLLVLNLGIFILPITYAQSQNLLPPLEDWTVNFGADTHSDNVRFDEPNLLTLDYDSLANQATVLYSPLVDCAQVESAAIQYFYESYHSSALLDNNYRFALYVATNPTNIGALANALLDGSEAGLTKIFEKTGGQELNIYQEDLSSLIAGQAEVYFVIRGISVESESVMRFIRPQITASYPYQNIENWDYSSNTSHPDTTYIDDFTIESTANINGQIDTLTYDPFDFFDDVNQAHRFDFSYLLDNNGETDPNLQPSVKVVVETEAPNDYTIFEDSGDTNGEYISQSVAIEPFIVAENIKAIHIIMEMPVTAQRVGFSLERKSRNAVATTVKTRGAASTKQGNQSCLQRAMEITLKRTSVDCYSDPSKIDYLIAYIRLEDEKIVPAPTWRAYILVPHDAAENGDSITFTSPLSFPNYGNYTVELTIPEEYGNVEECLADDDQTPFALFIPCCEEVEDSRVYEESDDLPFLIQVSNLIQLGKQEATHHGRVIIDASETKHFRAGNGIRFEHGFIGHYGSHFTVDVLLCGEQAVANKGDGRPDHSTYLFNVEEESPFNYKLYPNPASNWINIEYTLETDAVVNLKVYNAIGMEMTQLIQQNQQASGKQTILYSLEELATGIYFFQLQVGHQHQTIQLIKAK